MKWKPKHTGAYGTISCSDCYDNPEFNPKKYICGNDIGRSCGDSKVIDGVRYCFREWLKPMYLSWGGYYKCDYTAQNDIPEQLTLFEVSV